MGSIVHRACSYELQWELIDVITNTTFNIPVCGDGKRECIAVIPNRYACLPSDRIYS